MVIEIPDDIQIGLWSEWIEIDGLADLDTAICSKDLRPAFMELISEKSFVHKSKSDYFEEEYIIWLAIRQIRVVSMDLDAFAKISFPT